MKRCPECRRDYYDETLLFCLDDGERLLEGPASVDEPVTAFLPSTSTATDAPTRAQIHTTDHTAVSPTVNSGGAPGVKAPLDTRLVLVPVVAILLAVAAFFGYRQFISGDGQVESIAVMPFVNDSGSADVEYLSDGMTETLINSLSQIPNLSVKARSSVFRYKGREFDLKKLAAELGVQAILTGRVIQRGDQLTLNVELVDALTENTLWGNKYERKSSDLVSLQSEVARDVSNRLKSKLSWADVANVGKSYTTNPEAYQLYLKGRFAWNKRTGTSLKQAAEFFKQATEKDPNYALAYSGLAETYSLFSTFSVARAKDSMPQAKAAAERALELDSSLAEPHTALEMYFTFYEYDRVAGESEIRRAIEINTNYATAHQWLGSDLLTPTKRFDESLASLRRAETLDPLSPIIGTNLGDVFLFSRRYDEALDQYQRTLSLDPNFPLAYYSIAQARWMKGMRSEAVADIKRYIELSDDPSGKGELAFFLAKTDEREEALTILAELQGEAHDRYVQSYAFALVYIGLGDREKAYEFLNKEIDEHGMNANYYSINPELDELRPEPRFKAMLKRLNLPE